MSRKVVDSNLILNSYEILMKKLIPQTKIINKDFNKIDNMQIKRNSNARALSELKQISRYQINKNRMAKISTPRTDSVLRNLKTARDKTPRSNSPMKIKSARERIPLPPISLNSADKSEIDDPIQNLKNYQKNLLSITKIITRFFKTTDSEQIKIFLNNLKRERRDLFTKQAENESSIQLLQNQRSKIESSIRKFSPIKIRDALLLTEAKAALSFFYIERENSNKIFRDLQAQKNALLISSNRLSNLLDLTEVNDYEDLIDLYKHVEKIFTNPKVKSIIKLSSKATRSRVSFSIPEFNAIRIDEENNQQNEINVPTLSLNAISGNTDFFPGTRSTRRAFSAMNSSSDFREDVSSQGNNDLQSIGKILGNIFVERYYSLIASERDEIKVIENNYESQSLSPIFRNKVDTYSSQELLKCLFDQYIKYQDFLFLSVLSSNEIVRIEKSFIQFADTRDYLLSLFNMKFDEQLLISMYDYILNADDVVACYFIRDIFIHCSDKITNFKLYSDKLFNYYQKRRLTLSSVNEISKCVPFIAFFAVYSTFLGIDKNSSSLISLFDQNLIKILKLFNKSMNCSLSRCGIVAVYRLAKYVPRIFSVCLEFQNKVMSNFLLFLKQNIQYATCVEASTEFFNKAYNLISIESKLMTTSILFHFIIGQSYNSSGYNAHIVSALLSTFITIVANRNKNINEQLISLHCIHSLMKNIELETFRLNPDINIKIDHVNPVQSDEVKSPRVSYLNLPTNILPPLNFENPKLQLHFQPQALISKNSLRSSMSMSADDYMKKRKRYPIYLSKEIHSLYIQLMFALLIDHKIHRLDSFFCDPFPQVNRKPNVLFVLMKHMEEKENQDIVDQLEQSFMPIELKTKISLLKDQKEFRVSVSNHPKLKNSLLLDDKTESNDSILDNQNELNNHVLEDPKGSKKSSDHPSIEKRLDMVQFKSAPNLFTNKLCIQDLKPKPKDLIQISEKIQYYQDYMRLLRLTAPSCFHIEHYSNGVHLGSGAFGAVMGVTYNNRDLAIKELEKSRNETDNPHLIEVYTEVSILEMCKGDRRVTQLFDYGCTFESYYIVMEYYPMTLKKWRKLYGRKNGNITNSSGNIEERFEDSYNSATLTSEESNDDSNDGLVENEWGSLGPPPFDVCLRLFREFLNCATVLTDYHINHFDIKCDNVMIDIDGKPALADFGESLIYNNETNCYTLLNKGTEWIKSPEMVSISLDSSATSPNYDRLKKIGAGPASDVWSIGCLFFELIAGEFLFIDTDWSRFFMRITSPEEPILTDEKLKMLPNDPRYKTFIEFVLQRNVTRRPNLQQVINKFDEIFPDAPQAPLPVIEKKSFRDQ